MRRLVALTAGTSPGATGVLVGAALSPRPHQRRNLKVQREFPVPE